MNIHEQLEPKSEDVQLAVEELFTGHTSEDTERLLVALCSIAISLKRIADNFENKKQSNDNHSLKYRSP